MYIHATKYDHAETHHYYNNVSVDYTLTCKKFNILSEWIDNSLPEHFTDCTSASVIGTSTIVSNCQEHLIKDITESKEAKKEGVQIA